MSDEEKRLMEIYSGSGLDRAMAKCPVKDRSQMLSWAHTLSIEVVVTALVTSGAASEVLPALRKAVGSTVARHGENPLLPEWVEAVEAGCQLLEGDG